jgi:hypothetical protein
MVIRPTNDQHKRPAAAGAGKSSDRPPGRVPRLAIKEWGPIRTANLPPNQRRHVARLFPSGWEANREVGTSCTTLSPSPAFRDLRRADDCDWTPGISMGSSGGGRLIYTADWPWTRSIHLPGRKHALCPGTRLRSAGQAAGAAKRRRMVAQQQQQAGRAGGGKKWS